MKNYGWGVVRFPGILSIISYTNESSVVEWNKYLVGDNNLPRA